MVLWLIELEGWQSVKEPMPGFTWTHSPSTLALGQQIERDAQGETEWSGIRARAE